jgi:phosphoribosyl 1,2-cyclic phosphate phosphodiesterase
LTITFLGTGSSQGVPVIACSCSVCHPSDAKDKRLRSSLHLTQCGTSILIDSGPDLRQQVLSAGIEQLDALLLTHEHRDHTGGLSEMRSFVFKQKKTIPIYTSVHVLGCVQQEYSYLFDTTPSQETCNFELHPIKNTPFEVEGLMVVPIQVYHGTLPIWGFRIGGLTYITDAKVIAEEEVAKIKGTTVLVVNALQQGPNPSHFSLAEAIDFAQRVNAETTYLTHISHKLGRHQAVSKALPSGIYLAYDGLQVSL